MSDPTRRQFLEAAAAVAALTAVPGDPRSVDLDRQPPTVRGCFMEAGTSPADVGVAATPLENTLTGNVDLTTRATNLPDAQSFVEVVAYLDWGNVSYGLDPVAARTLGRHLIEAARFAEEEADA